MTVDHAEAAMCLTLIAADPASWVHAQQNGWDHPLSREGILMASVFDSSEATRLERKFKPAPRPWPNPGTHRYGATTLTPEAAKTMLRRNREGALHV